jgi:hypothetical protein
VLADAQRLAAMPTRTLGNWSLGQILRHLAMSLDMMIDGPTFMLPAPLRWIMRPLMLKRFLKGPLNPGFKIPQKAANMVPPATTTEQGLEQLRTAVARIKGTSQRGPHPAFGTLTQRDWDTFQLRHCEMHMSFVVEA